MDLVLPHSMHRRNDDKCYYYEEEEEGSEEIDSDEYSEYTMKSQSTFPEEEFLSVIVEETTIDLRSKESLSIRGLEDAEFVDVDDYEGKDQYDQLYHEYSDEIRSAAFNDSFNIVGYENSIVDDTIGHELIKSTSCDTKHSRRSSQRSRTTLSTASESRSSSSRSSCFPISSSPLDLSNSKEMEYEYASNRGSNVPQQEVQHQLIGVNIQFFESQRCTKYGAISQFEETRPICHDDDESDSLSLDYRQEKTNKKQDKKGDCQYSLSLEDYRQENINHKKQEKKDESHSLSLEDYRQENIIKKQDKKDESDSFSLEDYRQEKTNTKQDKKDESQHSLSLEDYRQENINKKQDEKDESDSFALEDYRQENINKKQGEKDESHSLSLEDYRQENINKKQDKKDG